MKAQFPFFASIVLAALSSLAGCNDPAHPDPAPSGDGSPTSGGSGGPASGDVGTTGITGATAGMTTAGVTGTSGGVTADIDAGSEPVGTSGGASTVPATFDTFKLIIEQAPCFGAGCHNDDQNPLDLRVDDQLYTRVTTLVSNDCAELPIVNPGNPQQSALVQLLRGPCGETPRMPIGCVDDLDANCVPPEYIAAIEQWIAAGAPPQ